MKTIMLQAASQRGILTEERLQAALKPGADLHQARAGRQTMVPPELKESCHSACAPDSRAGVPAALPAVFLNPVLLDTCPTTRRKTNPALH